MDNIRQWIGNDFIFYAIIIILIILTINIFSKFLNNFVLLVKNFKLIGYYTWMFFKKIVKFIFSVVFFPWTFYRWTKEFRQYNAIIIDNTIRKDLES